jgi:hypothetical protein
MSIAPAVSAWQLVRATTTVRQFHRAVGWALLAVGVGGLIYATEKYLLVLDRRFIENPADVMMRAFALAHFLVGWLFLFTSPRLRDRRAVTRLAAATLLGIGLCAVFAAFGATRNPLLVMFFYSYFLVHEVRDETHLYQVYGDGALDPANTALLRSMSRAAAVLLMLVLVVSYSLYIVAMDKRTPLDRAHPWLLWAGMAVLGSLCCWAVRRPLQLANRLYGDWRGFVNAHRPLLVVYLALFALLVAGTPLGSTAFNFIILVHVTAWLVFVHYQLRRRPPRASRSLWGWLKSTPTGFLVLHLGCVAVVLVLMAMRVYVWQRVGFVSELLASSNFCYWGLMHISMAFWSSR